MADQWWGVARRPGGEVHVTAPRKDERSATQLAEAVEGDVHFAVQAGSKVEARRLAERRLSDEAIVPTETELKELAEHREQVDDAQALAKAAERASSASTEQRGPRPAERTGSWYGCARDAKGEPMVTDKPFSKPENARAAAEVNLPNGPTAVVAVQADSADEALSIYEALDREALPAEVAKPRPEGARASLL